MKDRVPCVELPRWTMWQRTKLNSVFVAMGVTIVLVCYYTRWTNVVVDYLDDVTSAFKQIGTESAATDLASCRIPEIAFHVGANYVARKKIIVSSIICEDPVVANGNLLRINRTALKKGQDIAYCTYSTMYRPVDGPDNKVLFKREVRFNNSVVLREGDDLLRVMCYDKNNKIAGKYHLVTIIPRKLVEERCLRNQEKFNNENNQQFNVVLLGIDSVSRANSLRYLSMTRDTLQKLEAIDMRIYHKVGLNTFPNNVALLTGKSLSEFLNGEDRTNYLVDREDFLWNNYSRAGYVTFFAEDAHWMSTFNYNKRGFKRAPTDYYMRPLFATTERRYPPKCESRQRQFQRLLDGTKLFTETFSTDSHFSFSFTSTITHDFESHASLVDLPVSQFIGRLRDSGAFQRNTVLVVYADHGMRFGPRRKTYFGSLEVHLPMMYIVLPFWFRKRYPAQWRYLQANVNRLTTPYDMHATLLHLLTGLDSANVPVTPHGLSLFNQEIVANRTCEEASIPIDYCACHKHIKLSLPNPHINGAANATVHWLNQRMSSYANHCAFLSLESIYRAEQLLMDNKNSDKSKNEHRNLHMYMLTFRTSPGNGEFEASVEYNLKSHEYRVLPGFSRINAYGNDGFCIDNADLQRTCYCLQLLSQSNNNSASNDNITKRGVSVMPQENRSTKRRTL